jgi:hypothetical protein
MYMLKLDSRSPYNVRWPVSDTAILAMGAAYVARETSLPTEQRVSAPPLSMVQLSLTAAQAARSSASAGEADRAAAAETYRQTVATARSRLDLAIMHLKIKYLGNLAQLEQWGLETKPTNKGISVRKPAGNNAWAAFLAAYVAKESSLPVGDQLTDPPLAEMTALAATLQAAEAARNAARNQREAGVQVRSEEVQWLLDLLQVAGAVLVTTQFNGRITNDLQQWGYQVVGPA